MGVSPLLKEPFSHSVADIHQGPLPAVAEIEHAFRGDIAARNEGPFDRTLMTALSAIAERQQEGVQPARSDVVIAFEQGAESLRRVLSLHPDVAKYITDGSAPVADNNNNPEAVLAA